MKIVIPFLVTTVALLKACGPVPAPKRSESDNRTRSRGLSEAEIAARKDSPTEDASSNSDITEKDNPNERNQGRSLKQTEPKKGAIGLVEIRPLIQRHCVRCHGATGSRSDLTQDAQVILRGAEIVRRTASKFNGMPSDNPKAVTDEEKELLKQWKLGGYQR